MDRILEIFALIIAAVEGTDMEALNAELVQLCTDLPDADLELVESGLLDLFDSVRAGEVEGVDARDLPALQLITTGVENIRTLAAVRIEAATAVDDEIRALEESLAATDPAAVDPTADPEGGTDPDDGGAAPAADPVVEPVTDDAAVDDGAQVPVTAAARPALGAARQHQPTRTRARADRIPAAPAPRDPHVRIVANTGGVLENMTAAADYMAREAHNLGPNAGKVPMVTIQAQYSPEDTFRETDDRHNRQVMESITAAAQDPEAWSGPDALTAAVWCAEAPVDYGLIMQAVADRPVLDALPSRGMERLSVRVPVSPTLSSVNVDQSDGVDNAVSIYTVDDEADDDFSKPIQAADCISWNTFEAYAIVKRRRFKVGAAMAYPENVAQINELTAAAWARKADSCLLGRIKNDAGTTEITEPDQVFGAAIDLIELVVRLGAYMRSAERTGGQARLRAMLPAWIIDMIQADIARSGRSVYNPDAEAVIARSKVQDMLSSANINAAFYLDTPINDDGSLSGPTQILGRQTDASTAEKWPCTIQFGLWFEGAFAVGDGGELNLGVNRNANNVARNEWETFYEKFETVIPRRGPEALWVQQTVLTTGAYAAPVDGDITCAGS